VDLRGLARPRVPENLHADVERLRDELVGKIERM